MNERDIRRQPEHEQGTKSFPTFQLRPDHVRAFLQLADKNGMQSMIKIPDILLALDERWQREGKTSKFTPGQHDVLAELSAWSHLHPELQRDRERHLAFRHVPVDSAHDDSLAKILEDAEKFGGRHPEDRSIGICVDQGHKTLKYTGMHFDTHPDQDAILFIYNEDNLEPLTEQERAQNINLAYFGMKPIPGKTIRDALVGAIVLPGKKKE